MSDILHTRKLGDSSVVRPQASNATTAATGTVANLPTALANAAVGTLIKALVASQTNRGLTTLQTDKGTITFQANMPLRIGNELVLQLQSIGTQTRALILSVDGKPIAEGSAAGSPGIGGQTPASGQGRSVFANTTGTAGGQPPDNRPGIGQGHANAPGLTQGKANNEASILSGQGARSNFATDIRGPVSTGLVLPAQVTSASTSAGNNGFKFTTGDMLTVRILGLAPDSAQPLRPSVPPVGPNTQILHGQVGEQSTNVANPANGTPNTPARSTLVTLDAGRITLAGSPPGPSGTQILFEVLEAHHPLTRGGNSPVGAYRDFLVLGADWQSLKQALNLAATTAPTATAIATETGSTIARPGAQMASTMLFFMAALKAGDMRAWLGDARVEQLTQLNQGQALSRLGEDFSLMSRHASDALGTGWHSLAIPIETRHHIEQFRLYYRKQGSSQDGQGDEETHFMVEADLSRFGLFQLEGLVRSNQFDLVVHSTRSLPSEMQGTIKGIYQESLNTGDLAGTIRFKGGATKPFNPTGGIHSQTDLPDGHVAAIVV